MDSIRSRCETFKKALTTHNGFSFKKVSSMIKTKSARLLIICIISSLLVFLLTGAAVSKYAILIDDLGNQVIVYTSESQPETILHQNNITLSPYDKFEFSGIKDNKATLKIKRAKKINITADGKLNVVYMADGTVKDALKNAKVSLDDDDLINASLLEEINADMDITINRVEYKNITENSEIPCDILKFPTQTLSKGKTRVLKQGYNGTLETIKKQTLIDGEVVEEITQSSKVIKKPSSTKLLVGDPNAPTSQIIPNEPIKLDANGNPLNFSRKITGKATAYSSLGRRTSLTPGNVAMNLSQFPKGTKLYIKTPNGSFVYGYSVVKDTGTAVNNGTILVDLFFDSYKESCLFGAKTVDIYVLS